MKILLAVVLGWCTSSLAQAPSAAKPDWSNFEFLVGSWAADADPAQPGVTGATIFRFDLDRAILVRENRADYPAQNGQPAQHHRDLMVISDNGSGALKATYWDNEPHTIYYDVTTSPGEISFTTAPGAAGPRFRLVYRRAVTEGQVTGRFDIAPPGGEFKTYRQWTMHRSAVAKP